MVPFAGFDMPVSYTGLIEEHTAVRERVGLFDVSHMGEFIVSGPDTFKYLDQVVTNDCSKLPDDGILYTVMCREDGTAVDDLLVSKIADDRALVVAVEDRLARELGLAPGELLLDYPAKTQMLGLDIPVLRRDGSVRRLTAEGWEGAINLPKLSEELYRSARWLRVFACRPVAVSREAIARLATLPAAEVRSRLEQGSMLDQ